MDKEIKTPEDFVKWGTLLFPKVMNIKESDPFPEVFMKLSALRGFLMLVNDLDLVSGVNTHLIEGQTKTLIQSARMMQFYNKLCNFLGYKTDISVGWMDELQELEEFQVNMLENSYNVGLSLLQNKESEVNIDPALDYLGRVGK